MEYRDYSFSPVPFLTIAKDAHKNADGSSVGSLYRFSLAGTIVETAGGYSAIDAAQDALIDAVAEDGGLFVVACDGTPLISGYVRVNPPTFNQSNDNWVTTCPYTLEFEMDDYSSETSPYISSSTENWSLEFQEDKSHYSVDLTGVAEQEAEYYYGVDSNPYFLNLTHSVSAIGKKHYTGPGISGALDKEAWEQARDFVIPLLGYESSQVAGSGVINLNSASFFESGYNHIRSQQTDETAGSFSVSESWTILSSGTLGNAIEDFSISTNKSIESDLTSVSINGTIQGVEIRTYGSDPGDFTIDETKYESASGYWNSVENRVFPRAQIASQSVSTRSLNPQIKSQSVGDNWVNGVITYNYEFDDRPLNCVSGSLSENITIADNLPTDVFASLTVIGRAAGPILQDIGTTTAASRDVSIEVTMPIPTGCTPSLMFATNPRIDVQALLCLFEAELTGDNDTVFKTNDSENWEPKTGRYSRGVSWTYQACSDSGTSLC